VLNLNNPLVLTTFLALANERLIEYVLATPLSKNLPDFYKRYGWLLQYVAFVVGGVLGYFAGVNLFVGTEIPDPVGRILTAAVIGGGSQLINIIMPPTTKPSVTNAYATGYVTDYPLAPGGEFRPLK